MRNTYSSHCLLTRLATGKGRVAKGRISDQTNHHHIVRPRARADREKLGVDFVLNGVKTW